MLVNELDGILQGDDHAIASLRDAADHGSQGGGFPSAGDAGDKNEATA